MLDMSNTWDDIFSKIKEKEYYKSLSDFIDTEYKKYACYPPKELIFNAFKLTPYENVKVVIFGQDPYHEKGQAMGLAFSVPDGIKVPPSLKNIQQEITNEFGLCFFANGDLSYLAKQGVLLLNAILSVREGEPLSHNIKEYQYLLKDIINEIENNDNPIVYLLWGGNAKKLEKYITNKNHLVLEANHPSPLSANKGGWFGCNHFLKTNEFLKKNNILPISWFESL